MFIIKRNILKCKKNVGLNQKFNQLLKINLKKTKNLIKKREIIIKNLRLKASLTNYFFKAGIKSTKLIQCTTLLRNQIRKTITLGNRKSMSSC